MIRLRDKQGNLLTLSTPVGFVEICNEDGKVACAVYTDSNNFVHIVTANDKEAARYKQIFNTDFCTIVDVPKELKD